LIPDTLVADGRLQKGAVSASTVRRLFAEKGLNPVALRDGGRRGKVRLRWQAERPGALWQGDICHAASLRIGGTTRPVRIHALLDDASRSVVGLEAMHAEREVAMLAPWCGPCANTCADRADDETRLQVRSAAFGFRFVTARFRSHVSTNVVVSADMRMLWRVGSLLKKPPNQRCFPRPSMGGDHSRPMKRKI
jgi:hypothetical protein